MAKPEMRVVRPEPASRDDRSRGRMRTLRRHLLVAAVLYVRDGAEMTRPERLRLASDLSGIPIGMIEAEERKR